MDRQRSCLTSLGFGVLAFNSVLAIYSASVAFVLLFLCLREFERGGGRGRGRDAKTKAAVWALTTLLTAMFASRVVPQMPPLVGALVWAMAVATAAGSLWVFFLNP